MNTFRLWPFPISVLVLLFVATACDPDEPPAPLDDSKEKNAAKPNANNLIISEATYGESDVQTSIYELIGKTPNSFYFYAKKGVDFVVGEISVNGELIWENKTAFNVRGIYKISSMVPKLHNCLLVYGSSNNSGQIALYSPSGNFLSNSVFNNESQILFNAVTKSKFDVSTLFSSLENQNISTDGFKKNLNLFIAMGSAVTNGSTHPFISYFTISNDGKIQNRPDLPDYINIQSRSQFFTSYKSAVFNEIASNVPFNEKGCEPIVCDASAEFKGGQCNDTIVRFNSDECSYTYNHYTSLYTETGDNNLTKFSAAAIHENINCSYKLIDCELALVSIVFEPIEMMWYKDVEELSYIFKSEFIKGRGSIMQSNCGNIYVVGGIEIEKAQPYIEQKFWDAGFIASLDKDGKVNWSRNFSVSDYSDKYTSCISDGTSLYACGYYAQYSNDTNHNTFGYGLISKIDLKNGSILSHKYFGNSLYRSGFNTITELGGKLFVAGATKYEKYDINTPYQGWLVEIQKGGI